jgi:hypothetical protein
MSHVARIPIVVLSCTTVLLLAGPAEAKNIFEIIFGPPLGSQARRTHPVRHVGRVPHFHHTVATKLPARVVRGSSRQRYGRLSRPQPAGDAEPVKTPRLQLDAQQAQVMPSVELVENILSDPTLRRGDVIEFPDGPRVYKGNGRFSAHKVSDFEQVREAGASGASQLLPSAGALAGVTEAGSALRGR